MRTREEAHVEYNWLSPREFGLRAGGQKPATIIAAIKAEEIAPDHVQRTRGGHYRIHPDALPVWLDAHRGAKAAA